MTESEAQAVARVVGGDAWNSGGGIQLVVIERPDGRVVAISDEAVCEYADCDAKHVLQQRRSAYRQSEP